MSPEELMDFNLLANKDSVTIVTAISATECGGSLDVLLSKLPTQAAVDESEQKYASLHSFEFSIRDLHINSNQKMISRQW